VEFVEGELADRPALEKIFISAKEEGKPFDGVLHFAALIEAGESMLHPEQFFRNNTASTLPYWKRFWPMDPAGWSSVPQPLFMASRKWSQSKKMRACCRPTPTANPSCWWSICSAG